MTPNRKKTVLQAAPELVCLSKRIRFESGQDVYTVLEAAELRGLSFSAFVTMAALATARKVLQADPGLESFVDPEAVKSTKVA